MTAKGWENWCIWWTSEEDCRAIGEPHDMTNLSKEDQQRLKEDPNFCLGKPPFWPRYIWALYSDRYGRAGRGRLWVPTPNTLNIEEWNVNGRFARAAIMCGGIVIKRRDAILIAAYPGFITTEDLQPFNIGHHTSIYPRFA